MAKKKKKTKFTVDFSNFADYLARLDNLGGISAMKKGVNAGLKASKNHVNTQIRTAMSNAKLPRKGKYSSGDTIASLDESVDATWKGLRATVPIGFKLQESGLTSIFLMYGTPRMKPARGLKAAIYGTKARKQHNEIVAEALENVIAEIMGE